MEFKMRILIIYKVILLSQGKSSSETKFLYTWFSTWW